MADSLTLSREEFERRLVAPDPTAAPVAPVAPRREVGAAILARAARPGVPLDVTTGAPFLTRLNVSRAPDDATRLDMLRDAFAGAGVEQVPPFYPGGPSQFVVRDYKDPSTGQLKDLLVDEAEVTAKDLADLGQVGVEFVGALAAMRGGSGLARATGTGFGRLLTESALANTGAALAGAVSDVQAIAGTSTRTASDAPLAGIAAQRALQAGAGAALDVGLGSGVVAATKLANTIRGVPVSAEARAAQAANQRLAAATGTKPVPMTIGQRTGSQSLLESEAFLENVTFGGGPLRRFRQRQEALLQAQEGGIVGPGPLPDKDTLGGQAVRALREVATGLEGATATARADALTGAMGLLESAIDTSTGLGTRAVLAREAGTAIQLAQSAKKEAFDEVASQLKATVTAVAGTDAFIPSAIARKHLQPLLKRITRPGTSEFYEYVPPKVKAFVNDVMGLPQEQAASVLGADDIMVFQPAAKGTVTLSELQDLRTGVNAAISESQILGTAESQKLSSISHALTLTLEEGIEHAPNPGAKAALDRFNRFYRENIEGFQVKGVTELLADPTQRKLGPSAIYHQAADNPDQYFRVKEALTKPLMLEGQPVGPVTASEATWRVFKQGMLTEMVEGTRVGGSGRLVDANRFLGRLAALDKEVRDDLLGKGAADASTALARLEALQNPKLDGQEVLEVLRRGGSKVPAEIEALAKREAEASALYRNQVIRRFVKGEVGSESIQPGQFIDRYLDVAPHAELREVMLRLEATDPALADTIRRKTVSNLFQTARKDPLSDVTSAKKLATEIKAPEMQERLEAVLGRTKREWVNDFLDVLTATQPRVGSSVKAMGGISGGAARNDVFLLRMASWPKQAWRYTLGAILTNPTLHRIATGPVQPLDPTVALRSIILADDFVAGAVQEFGREAGTVLAQMQSSLDASQPPPTRSRADFERALQPVTP